LKSLENRKNELKLALCDIEKLLASWKTKFQASENGLQSYWAWAIQSHLHMVVNWGRRGIDASEIAAESHGFAREWGG
jgi:hypothetical protein